MTNEKLSIKLEVKSQGSDYIPSSENVQQDFTLVPDFIFR